MPFKRYQIQNVWRAENTQKGRFREFLQCDIDIVGISSPLADAEIITVAEKSLEKLGFSKFKILINDREVFKDLPKEAITTIDKLKKIGREKVLEELSKKKIDSSIIQTIELQKPTDRINQISSCLNQLRVGSPKPQFSPTLARGLDYYTGMIFEIEIEGYSAGSVCGGGRYDNLIGLFANKQIPAVGCAFGFDRLMEAMDELKLFPENLQTTKVLVTIFSPELLDKSIEVCEILNANKINQELYIDPAAKLEKQLRYADQKGIPYVAIIGPKEAAKNEITLRSMQTKEQKTLTQKDLVSELV